MRGNWRSTIGVLLLTTASLPAAGAQTAERAAEDHGNAKVGCDAFTLEGLAPGMKYTEVADLLKAMSPKPRSAGKQRNYDAASRVQAVHSWQVEAGTIEVWYAGEKADRKTNPTVVRVRLLVPEDSVSVEALWKSVFDRFGPMSNWERDDCNISVVVGLYKNQAHTTLSLLTWERALEGKD